MLCDKCKSNPATIKYQQIFNGKQTTLNLCSQCAKEAGVSFDMDLDMGGFLASMFNLAHGAADSLTRVKCPACGYTLEKFNKTGLLGCSDCYDAFHDALEGVIRNVQGATKYVPGAEKKKEASSPADEIARVRAELYEAVKKEEYEKAAVLRDQLKALEGDQSAPKAEQ